MRVLVVGANGLIGGYVTTRLIAEGHNVVGTARSLDLARRREPRATWVRADMARTSAADWRPLLSSVDAVINCAGALQNGPRDDLEALHVDGLVSLATAAMSAGVRRFIQVSAVGVESGHNQFSQTKARGEAALAEFDIDWIVIRPGLVLAPAAYGGSALLRGLAAFPWAIPAAYGDSIVQVVSAEDVAACAARAIDPETPARFVATLAAERTTTLVDLLRALRAWLGIAPAPIVAIPALLARVCATIADALAWLGWRSAMRSTAIDQLRAGVRGCADDGASRLGFAPREMEDILSGWPSGVQERWFARLYFLKPVVMATLAMFWFGTGVIAVLARGAAARALFTAGFSHATATVVVLLGAGVDIVLGLLICVRSTAALALKGMVLTSLIYLAGATVWRSDLWSDPMGPLLKAVPATVLALVGLAILDER
jgi:uncharacterized protein YbjT (DUF2867 family)